MPDYLGFSDNSQRSRLAPFYHRRIGATQDEIDTEARRLGIHWRGKYNMLDKADEWGHEVWTWDDPRRGRVFKLVYNPNHSGPPGGPRPANWEDMNILDVPSGIVPQRWHRQHRDEAA
jgi:hypothetical protein